MNKIDLIKEIEQGERKLSALLRKAKRVLRENGIDEHLGWINKELDGYKKEEDTPDYRTIKGVPQVLNHYKGWIPMRHENEEAQNALSKLGVIESIPDLENFLETDDDVAMKFSKERERLISDAFKKDTGVSTCARLNISKPQLRNIITAVRNKLLDKLVSIEGELESKNKNKESGGSGASIFAINSNIATILGASEAKGGVVFSQEAQENTGAGRKIVISAVGGLIASIILALL